MEQYVGYFTEAKMHKHYVYRTTRFWTQQCNYFELFHLLIWMQIP